MNLRYNYKLYPNHTQVLLLQNHFFTSNQAFNIAKSILEKEYKLNKILKRYNIEPSYYSDSKIDKMIKEILTKRDLKYNTKVLQQSRKIFKDSMKKFFKSIGSSNQLGMIDYKKSSRASGSFEKVL